MQRPTSPSRRAVSCSSSSAHLTPPPRSPVSTASAKLSISPAQRYPFTLKYQLNALVSYAMPINDSLAIACGANGNYQGKLFGSLDEDPVFDVKSYTVVHCQDSRWSIGLYARNLFTGNYYTATDILTDTSIRVPGMMRTYGLVASFKH